MIVRYLVTIDAETTEQAEQVIAERCSVDEDYGFDYTIETEFHSKSETGRDHQKEWRGACGICGVHRDDCTCFPPKEAS